MKGEIFDHWCPLVVDQPAGTLPLAEDRKINFFSDGSMVFMPEPPPGHCTSAPSFATVNQESDPYERLMRNILGCEHAEVIKPKGPVSRLLALFGFNKPKAECPAALKHFDYSSRRQIKEYFGKGIVDTTN